MVAAPVAEPALDLAGLLGRQEPLATPRRHPPAVEHAVRALRTMALQPDVDRLPLHADHLRRLRLAQALLQDQAQRGGSPNWMPTLKLHYEGWVSLPAALRQQLGSNSGDRLEVDLVDGAIVLRPAATTKRPAPREDQQAAINSPAPDAPETLTRTDAVPARRKPGRPRKHEAAAEVVAPAPKRPRGRPRAVRAPEAEPAPVRAVSNERASRPM